MKLWNAPLLCPSVIRDPSFFARKRRKCGGEANNEAVPRGTP